MNDDAPTPRTSSSFAVFHDEAVRLARRLDDAALVMGKPGPHVDARGQRRAREMAAELRDLAAKFATWPTADAMTVAMERPSLTARLLELNRAAEELLATLPKTWPPRGR